MANPLISCICVTRSELALPFHCFSNQTYDNLELVFVHNREEWDDTFELDGVRYIYSPLEDKLTLGELYNLGVESAQGEYCIIWDSDDWYHPERVERQYEEAQRYRNKSIVLSHWHILDRVEGKAYLSSERTWEGSLLAPKKLLQKHPYPKGSVGVDSRVIEAFNKCEGGIGAINQPDLYVYSLHADNTCGSEHGKYIKQQSTELPEEYAQMFEARFIEAEQSDYAASAPMLAEGSIAPVVELGVLSAAEETVTALPLDVDESGQVDKGSEGPAVVDGVLSESSSQSPVEAKLD